MGTDSTRRERPADFAEVALTMTTNQLRVHYVMGGKQLRRIMAEMPAEWLERREAIMWKRRSDGGRTGAATVNAVRFANRKPKAPPKRPSQKATPIPADFVQRAIEMTNKQLAAHYGIGTATLHRMMGRLPEAERAIIREAGAARAAAASAENAKRAVKVRIIKQTAERRKTPGSASPVNWGFAKPVDMARQAGGVDAMAMDHLRRATRFIPVCKAETIYGAQGAGLYIVGRMQLDHSGLLAMATKHGFAPDAWRRLAA